MRAVHALPLATLLAACTPDPGDSARDTSPPAFEPLVQITTAADGWLRGDLHMHSEHSDGWDTVATVIDIAEYLEHPTFLAHHPEYQGSGLDFIAMTDHRTVAQNSDPDFVSDRLVLIPSEEYGSSGHANTPGVSAFLDHDPEDDGVSVEDYQAGIEAAHAQGALFSPNHPFAPGIMFGWDVHGFDTIEVWNSGWLLASPPTTADDLANWEQNKNTTAPAAYHRAVQAAGLGADGQTLTWYEALLSRGGHVGLVGGGDRHAITLVGFPTTYVQTASADVQGLLDGMRDRHSYVTRTPASAQLLGTVTVGDEEYQWGDAVPIPAAGALVTVQLRIARAEGGLARLVSGPAVADDEALLTAPLGSVLVEESIDSQDHTLEYSFDAVPGDWIYPLVLEPLFAPGITEEQQQIVLETAQAAAESGDDAMDIATAVVHLIDTELLASPDDCDPEDWQPDMLQCSLADMEGLTSFFVPDMLDRAMNAWIEDGELTEHCMGAVASAVLFVEEQG
jgi:hypothetical protein